MKINCKNWHMFLISDIFETETISDKMQVPTGAYVSKKDLKEGLIPRITVSGINNGVLGYYKSEHKNYRVFENFISVSFLGTVFYQPQKASLDMKVHCLKPKHISLNQNIASFLVTIIKKALLSSNYSDQISSTVLPTLEIKLPSKINNGINVPDWEYMDNYVEKLQSDIQEKIRKLSSLSVSKHKLHTDKWETFKIGDLFPKIIQPKVYHSKELKEEITGIPYVVRSKYNNGIKFYVHQEIGMQLNPAGTISFGAENATFFYQPKAYVSGRDIYYIDTTYLSQKVCLFITSCLQTITNKYSYNYGMFPELVKNETIKLPVDNKGNPDWKYMEKYIENIESKSKNLLDNIRHLANCN